MDIGRILAGPAPPLSVYSLITPCLDDIQTFPDTVESICTAASGLDEVDLERLRFGLLRVQIYADIHRNEDIEKAQQIKYVAQVLEKLIFGSLMMEQDNNFGSTSDE